jgi:hypothetical protein
LAKVFFSAIRQGSSRQIGGSSRGVLNDQVDGLGGIILGCRRKRSGQEQDSNSDPNETLSRHFLPPFPRFWKNHYWMTS